MKKILAIALIFLSTNAVAQWKSYYPEGIKNKKQKKQENKTDQQIKFNTHFYNALSLKTLESYEEALFEFNKCIEINASNPVPFYESALIYKSFSQVESAVENAKKAYDLNKENIWYQLLYAELLVMNNHSNKAAVIYKQMIKKHPGNEEYYLLLADNYIFA